MPCIVLSKAAVMRYNLPMEHDEATFYGNPYQILASILRRYTRQESKFRLSESTGSATFQLNCRFYLAYIP